MNPWSGRSYPLPIHKDKRHFLRWMASAVTFSYLWMPLAFRASWLGRPFFFFLICDFQHQAKGGREGGGLQLKSVIRHDLQVKYIHTQTYHMRAEDQGLILCKQLWFATFLHLNCINPVSHCHQYWEKKRGGASSGIPHILLVPSYPLFMII